MGDLHRARPSIQMDWLEAQRLAQAIPHWRHPEHRAAVNRWAQAVLTALKRERGRG